MKFSFSVTINNPTREEHLQNKADKLITKKQAETIEDKIACYLQVLSNDEFVIFGAEGEDEEWYVQFQRMQTNVILDYPFSVIDSRSKLMHRIDYLLHRYKFKNGLSYFQKVSNDYSRYYAYHQHGYGTSLSLYCGLKYDLAGNLAADIFKDVYGLDDFELVVEYGSDKRFWF